MSFNRCLPMLRTHFRLPWQSSTRFQEVSKNVKHLYTCEQGMTLRVPSLRNHSLAVLPLDVAGDVHEEGDWEKEGLHNVRDVEEPQVPSIGAFPRLILRNPSHPEV